MPSLPRKRSHRHALQVSRLAFRDISVMGAFSELHMVAKAAWKVGRKVFSELVAIKTEEEGDERSPRNQTTEKCPHSIVMSGTEFTEKGKIVVLPCGLTLGSHITLVARPYKAHPEYDPKISVPMEGDQATMVELQGLKTVDGEEPPRILHFNPRLKGDWSGKPVIELNTCYRMQWGPAKRCEGWKSRADEEYGKESIIGRIIGQKVVSGKVLWEETFMHLVLVKIIKKILKQSVLSPQYLRWWRFALVAN